VPKRRKIQIVLNPSIRGHHTSFDVELLFKKAAGQGKSDKSGMLSPD
jgi:hypothetical protein